MNTTDQKVKWDVLKSQPINFYGMTKTVEEVCTVVNYPGEDLYLKSTTATFVAFLEEVLSKVTVVAGGRVLPRYTVEVQKNYFVVKDNPDLFLA